MKKIIQLFSFNGVASRIEWWLVLISWYPILFLALWIDSFVTGSREEPGWVFICIVLVSIWLLLATQVRRWHDRGKSGYWCFIKLIPAIGVLWAIVELGFFPPVGNDPYGTSNDYR